MKTVHIVYEHCDGQWIATSSDLPGYRAVADFLPDVRSLVFDGIPFFVEDAEVDIREKLPNRTAPVVVVTDVHVSHCGVTVGGLGEAATLHEVEGGRNLRSGSQWEGRPTVSRGGGNKAEGTRPVEAGR